MVSTKRQKYKSPRLKEITRARERRLMTLHDMAKRLIISPTSVKSYEQGGYAPPPETWAKMKVILDLPGDMSDYWPDRLPKGRPVVVDPNALCERPNCSEKAFRSGLCLRHYRQKLRRRKKVEEERIKNLVIHES
jgi:transcriptional regulator with XRE-family HTH domain